MSPLPGKNGNPTFAAVAAGYDKSPGKHTQVALQAKLASVGVFFGFFLFTLSGTISLGGSGPSKSDTLGKSLAHMTSVESDSSDR